MGAVLLLGCANPISGNWPVSRQSFVGGDDPRVIAQVCLPDKVVTLNELRVDLAAHDIPLLMCRNTPFNHYPCPSLKTLDEIKRLKSSVVALEQWVPKSVDSEIEGYQLSFSSALVGSAGDGAIYLSGATLLQQPIFEQVHHRPLDVLAYGVRLVNVGHPTVGQRMFWFKLPTSVSKDGFSPWVDPVSEEDDEDRNRMNSPTHQILARGGQMPLFRVRSKIVPKMRFKLTTFEDAENERRFGDIARRIVFETGDKKFPPEDWKKHVFIMKKAEAIPSC